MRKLTEGPVIQSNSSLLSPHSSSSNKVIRITTQTTRPRHAFCRTRQASRRSDVGQVEEMFGKMAEGGYITMPLQETHWAYRFGMLTDKYGINWMFNCDKPHDEIKETQGI